MIQQLYQRFLESTGVSTDTRTIKKDNIWFALRGPNFNANEFADQALEKGARTVVIDDASFAKDSRYFLVEDALETLQLLANSHRQQFNIPFIGITGSNGKTTTKELVRDVLAEKYKVHATRGNLNNHIGVPLTLLEITQDVEIAIIEMGANKQKDIEELCRIAEPNYGFITNIGKAHLEGFGGLEGVFKGKTELYEHLTGVTNSTVFVNTANDRLLEKANRLIEKVVTFYAPVDDFHAEMKSSQPKLVITTEGIDFESSLSGSYNFENICSALCIGKHFGVKLTKAVAAVEAYIPDNNRSQVIEKGSNTVLLDAYNANPSSMKLSLENFAKQGEGYKMAILGDMLELGRDSEDEHRAIGKLTTQLTLDEVHFVGPLMKSASEMNTQAKYWPTKNYLEKYLREIELKDTQIMIKGSRGISLESVLEFL